MGEGRGGGGQANLSANLNVRNLFAENRLIAHNAGDCTFILNTFCSRLSAVKQKKLGNSGQTRRCRAIYRNQAFFAVRTGAAAVKTAETKISESLARQIDALVEPG
jgi:hypothetical protein